MTHELGNAPPTGAAQPAIAAVHGLPQNGQQIFASERKRAVLLMLLLLAVTLALYNPASRHEFVNYDDNLYITQNQMVQHGLSWKGIEWAFTTYDAANWHPLTWLSHMLDCTLFGVKPAGHHFVNVLWHALDVLLLFWFFWKTTGAQLCSFVLALLFAIHPLNVESVAWVAERKNLLCTAFWLLTMIAYARYAQRPGWRRYLPVVALFALALMAKPMAVTLPFALLLLDYWPLDRLTFGIPAANAHPANGRPRQMGFLVLEKIPLFALAVASCVITMRAQRSALKVGGWMLLPLSARLKNAAVAYVRYIAKVFWPAKLAVIYPHPGNSLSLGRALLAAAVLLLITAAVMVARRRPYLLVGWFWFLGTLVPMIGLVQVGDQAMADRYAYVPVIGLFLMIVWGLAEWAAKQSLRLKSLAAVAVLAISALAWQSARQLAVWRDSITLFSHAIAVTQRNFRAEVNLGGELEKLGRDDEALRHFYASAAANPNFGEAHYNIGFLLQRAGKLEDAAREYALALAHENNPLLAAHAENNLGLCLMDMGRGGEAESHFRRAIELSPNQFNSYYLLGHLLLQQGELAEAERQLILSSRILPTSFDYFDLGRVLEGEKKFSQAADAYVACLRLDPNSVDAQHALDRVRRLQLTAHGTK